MIVFKRKTRMISFRLSEEEYQTIRQASICNGARSISDYARDALFRLMNTGEDGRTPDGLRKRIDRLTFELKSLDRDVQRIREVAAGPDASTQ